MLVTRMRPAFRVLRARCASSSTVLFNEHVALMAAKTEDIFSQSSISMHEEDALLIIDVQKDFVPRSSSNPQGGAFGVSEADAILPLVTSLIAAAADASATIVATRDYHPHDHVSFESNGGAFPPHCLQGSEGAKFMPEVATALGSAYRRLGPERVHVAFKGFHEEVSATTGAWRGSYTPECRGPGRLGGDRGMLFSSSPSCATLTDLLPPRMLTAARASQVDSFAAFPYQGRHAAADAAADVAARAARLDHGSICGCVQSPWTGSLLLKQSNLAASGDMDAPPDILATLDDGYGRNLTSLVDRLQGTRRLFVCGLALDFCVLDTCTNARAALPNLAEIYLLADASRAAHIPGAPPGTFGSGFVTDPARVLSKLRSADVSLLRAADVLMRPAPAAMALATGTTAAVSVTTASAAAADMKTSAASDIKTMKLYHRPTWVDTELTALGYAEGASLTAEVLYPYDGMHYHGTAAVDEAVTTLKLTEASRVLDIGSGLGGPARQMASHSGCHVVALEMQRDLDLQARRYTTRCKQACGAPLTRLVEHVHGDILECDLSDLGEGPASFDHLTSWLCFLHIADKPALLRRCAAMLRPGGTLYLEDFYQRAPFTPAEAKLLSTDVYTHQLPMKAAYVSALTSAGFGSVTFEATAEGSAEGSAEGWTDMTHSWTGFVDERLTAWEAARERTINVHGKELYDARRHFFTSMQTLFRGGNLGGCRIVARLDGAK